MLRINVPTAKVKDEVRQNRPGGLEMQLPFPLLNRTVHYCFLLQTCVSRLDKSGGKFGLLGKPRS